MNLQDILVIVIVIVCILYAGIRMTKYFRSVRKGDNPCENCVSGCDLRRMMNEKQKECSKNNRKSNKNCCK